MDRHMTTDETSSKWGVTPKTVQNLCKQGKIDGAVKRAGIWFIPEDTQNPLKNTKSNAQIYNFVGTKKKIFDNALTLFIKNGYENVTVKDIASLTGIRQSAVYNHYESKQKILDTIYEYFKYYIVADRPKLCDIEVILQSGSPLEIIKSVRYNFRDDYVRQTMVEITMLAFQRQGIDEQARELVKKWIIEEGVKFTECVFNKAVELERLVPFDTYTLALIVNVISIYTLNIAMLDSSPESIKKMLIDEQNLFKIAAGSLIELNGLPVKT